MSWLVNHYWPISSGHRIGAGIGVLVGIKVGIKVGPYPKQGLYQEMVPWSSAWYSGITAEEFWSLVLWFNPTKPIYPYPKNHILIAGHIIQHIILLFGILWDVMPSYEADPDRIGGSRDWDLHLVQLKGPTTALLLAILACYALRASLSCFKNWLFLQWTGEGQVEMRLFYHYLVVK